MNNSVTIAVTGSNMLYTSIIMRTLKHIKEKVISLDVVISSKKEKIREKRVWKYNLIVTR